MGFNELKELKKQLPQAINFGDSIYCLIIVPTDTDGFDKHSKHILQNGAEITDELALQFSNDNDFRLIYLTIFFGSSFHFDANQIKPGKHNE